MATTMDIQSMRFTLGAEDMLNGLANMVLFASKDVTFPVLSAVHVVVKDGVVTFESTDRYRIGRFEIEARDGFDVANGDVVLPLSHVKTFITTLKAWAKAVARGAADVPVSFEALDGHMVKFSTPSGEVSAMPTIEQNFPGVARLFPDAMPVDDVTPTRGFNPAYLADFTKVKNFRKSMKDVPIKLHFQPNGKPVLVTFPCFEDVSSGKFVGALMPVRLP